MENLSYYINKKIVYVQIKRTSNKNMYLKIKDQDIVVLAPKKLSIKKINSFVEEHIEKFVKYIEDSKEAELYSIPDSFIWLYGKKFIFKVLTGFKKIKLVKKDSNVYIETKIGDNAEIEKGIKDYLKMSLMEYLEKVSPNFEKDMNVPPHINKVVYKTSTWGTNMTSKRTISYSSRLAHYKTDIIDYVIVHELAHFYEPNHQSNFWTLVEKEIPEYKKMRKHLGRDQKLSEE